MDLIFLFAVDSMSSVLIVFSVSQFFGTNGWNCCKCFVYFLYGHLVAFVTCFAPTNHECCDMLTIYSRLHAWKYNSSLFLRIYASM